MMLVDTVKHPEG